MNSRVQHTRRNRCITHSAVGAKGLLQSYVRVHKVVCADLECGRVGHGVSGWRERARETAHRRRPSTHLKHLLLAHDKANLARGAVTGELDVARRALLPPLCAREHVQLAAAEGGWRGSGTPTPEGNGQRAECRGTALRPAICRCSSALWHLLRARQPQRKGTAPHHTPPRSHARLKKHLVVLLTRRQPPRELRRIKRSDLQLRVVNVLLVAHDESLGRTATRVVLLIVGHCKR